MFSWNVRENQGKTGKQEIKKTSSNHTFLLPGESLGLQTQTLILSLGLCLTAFLLFLLPLSSLLLLLLLSLSSLLLFLLLLSSLFLLLLPLSSLLFLAAPLLFLFLLLATTFGIFGLLGCLLRRNALVFLSQPLLTFRVLGPTSLLGLLTLDLQLQCTLLCLLGQPLRLRLEPLGLLLLGLHVCSRYRGGVIGLMRKQRMGAKEKPEDRNNTNRKCAAIEVSNTKSSLPAHIF
jgi:hypothetical protein